MNPSQTNNNIKVYQIVFPNGKRYIGQTRQKLERRWKKGSGYKECPYVYQAIKKYGWENTLHELIADGLTQNQADELERELIAKYQTQNETYGYNLQSGGGIGRAGHKNTASHNFAISKAKSVPVVCYDKSGRFISEFLSAKAAAAFANVTAQEICKVRNGTSKTAGGYVWRFKGDAFNKYKVGPANGRSRKVMLITADNVRIFESATEAERETGIKHSLVLEYCKGIKHPRNHFEWKFYNEEVE